MLIEFLIWKIFLVLSPFKCVLLCSLILVQLIQKNGNSLLASKLAKASFSKKTVYQIWLIEKLFRICLFLQVFCCIGYNLSSCPPSISSYLSVSGTVGWSWLENISHFHLLSFFGLWNKKFINYLTHLLMIVRSSVVGFVIAKNLVKIFIWFFRQGFGHRFKTEDLCVFSLFQKEALFAVIF